MKKAIEGDGSDKDFAKLDDVIDSSGEAVAGFLDQLNIAAQKRQILALADVESTMHFASRVSMGLFLFSLLLMLPLLYVTGKYITDRLAGLTWAMAHLADRDLSTDIPFTDSRDEIGDMARSLIVFKDTMVKEKGLTISQEKESRARSERNRVISEQILQFEEKINKTIGIFSTSTSQLDQNSQTMAATAERAANQVEAVAGASSDTERNVDAVTIATDRLSSTVSSILEQVQGSTTITQNAVDHAKETGDRIEVLNSAAKDISEVIEIITAIADQTNLLALNATIESARAGESGKGFAVVASEVKNLASQTMQATEQISSQISRIQKETVRSVESITGIQGVIDELSENSQAMAKMIEDQRSATEEISLRASSAAEGTKRAGEHISGLQLVASEVGDTSRLVKTAVQELTEQSRTMQESITGFLDTVQVNSAK